ncbi:MAG: ribonuclease [Micrococcales bacterium]|nr:ribonuclease [Micrococcales bacterium]
MTSLLRSGRGLGPAATALLLGLLVALGLSGCALVRPAPETTSGSATQAAASRHTPSSQATPDSGLRRVPESQLPKQARATLDLIRAGGPFPYRRDGAVFLNRERILPKQRRGYYLEYTVRTPGEDDRGARRIVSGDDGDRYYTDDHYVSFRQIEEGQ